MVGMTLVCAVIFMLVHMSIVQNKLLAVEREKLAAAKVKYQTSKQQLTDLFEKQDERERVKSRQERLKQYRLKYGS